MTTTPPACLGTGIDDIDTPALLVDYDAYERNLSRMAQKLDRTGVQLRPHAKTHKCPIIGHQQITHGAMGVCCQKVGEAEAMVQGGIHDVLVSNEVVSKAKIRRLAALARLSKTSVCVDNPGSVDDLAEAARAFRVQIDVLIEIEVGMQRCGVPAGEEAKKLAQRVDRAKGLRLQGIQAYHGAAQHIRSFDERRRAIEKCVHSAEQTRNLFEKEGLNCDIVSGAGTGTHHFEIASGVYNELQVGSYIFMDADYLQNLDDADKPTQEFEPSLFVLTEVMSYPTEDRIVVDAGLKALSVDSGLPLVWHRDGMEYVSASDEHGVIRITAATSSIALGNKIKLLPGHCDPTVNMYDWYVIVRNHRVEDLWPITARGPGR